MRPAVPRLYDLALELGAAGWELFFLVPTGRASGLAGEELWRSATPPASAEPAARASTGLSAVAAARAYAATGDPLAEPDCAYEPDGRRRLAAVRVAGRAGR